MEKGLAQSMESRVWTLVKKVGMIRHKSGVGYTFLTERG